MSTLWRPLMKAKVLSLISTSLISLSVFVMQGHAHSTSIDEEGSRQAFRVLTGQPRYQMPPRYEHLQKLQAKKLRAARRHVQRLEMKNVTFRETVELCGNLNKNSQNQVSQDGINVTKLRKTKHERQKPISSKAEFLALPLSPDASARLKKMVPQNLQKVSQHELKVWVGFGDDNSRGELKRRHKNYQNRSARHLTKMIDSQHKEPCLPSAVPHYPFAYEVVGEQEQWKQMYMEANFILARDSASFEGRKLLHDVIKFNPHFKYPYYRLYKLEGADQTPAAVIYLKKAASGPNGLAVAQYEYGLHLLAQDKQNEAISWLRKASKQGYWRADETFRKLYLEKKQDIEAILKFPKRMIVVK